MPVERELDEAASPHALLAQAQACADANEAAPPLFRPGKTPLWRWIVRASLTLVVAACAWAAWLLAVQPVQFGA